MRIYLSLMVFISVVTYHALNQNEGKPVSSFELGAFSFTLKKKYHKKSDIFEMSKGSRRKHPFIVEGHSKFQVKHTEDIIRSPGFYLDVEMQYFGSL